MSEAETGDRAAAVPAVPTARSAEAGWPQPPVAVVGAVLCGGRSSRFGSDKALADADGVPVGARVVAALRGGGADPVAAIGGTAGPALAIPTIADLRPGEGPLPGLATALLWAKTGMVVVAPCDLVLLSAADVAALVSAAAANPGLAVVATRDGQPQVSLAVWPAVRGRDVLKIVDQGKRAFRAALDVVDWVGVELPPSALADADTPDELARLLSGRID